MLRLTLVALLSAACIGSETGARSQRSSQEWVPVTTDMPNPLPEVSRSGARKTVFDDPSIVVLVQFRQRWEIEELNVDRGSLNPPTFFHAAKADVFVVVRLNERRKGEPDLSRAMLVVDQKDRQGKQGLKFEFGRFYLLLLNAAPKPFYLDLTPPQPAYDAYTLAYRKAALKS